MWYGTMWVLCHSVIHVVIINDTRTGGELPKAEEVQGCREHVQTNPAISQQTPGPSFIVTSPSPFW